MPGKTIVFVNTKRSADGLQAALNDMGCAAASVHGDKDQRERERVLEDFKSGRCPILVATDVAARGLDIKGVMMVVNYEFPPKIENYIHRIGRTGRAGVRGQAVTFMSAADASHASGLLKILKESGLQKADIPKELRQMAKLMKPPPAAAKPGTSKQPPPGSSSGAPSSASCASLM